MKPTHLKLHLLCATICLILAVAHTQKISAACSNSVVVTNTSDAGAGSLRDAIANVCSGGTITFSNATTGGATNFFDGSARTITLTSGVLTIYSSMTLTGPGANVLTVSGNNASAVIDIPSVSRSSTVNLSGLTITGGNGMEALNTVAGGAIINNGTLTISNSVITGNQSAQTSSYTGGIYNFSTLTIIGSTISNNTARNPAYNNGGGISNAGTLTVVNSTISGNSATSTNGGNAGGILNFSGSATIINSTITNNGVASTSSTAGGVRTNGGTATLLNTIVAANGNNGTIGDVDGTFTSAGNNLIGNVGTATGFTNGMNGDQTGTSASPRNPQLLPLGYYGGQMLTHALTATSPAVNAGNNCVVTLTCTSNNPPQALTTDQRGASRVGQVDIGAFELNSSQNSGSYVATLPYGRVGQAYSFTIIPDVGSATYCLSSGTLPPGLNGIGSCPPPSADERLSSSAAQATAGSGITPVEPLATSLTISGTPSSSGIYVFSINGTNSGLNVTTYRLNVVSPTAAGVSINGTIVSTDGLPLSGVTVTLGGSRISQIVTDAAGKYRFDNLEASRFYTVTPARLDLVFTPASRAFFVNGADAEDGMFTGASVTNGGALVNPLDDAGFFVRQQYIDFLNREPDSAGFQFWLSELQKCDRDPACMNEQRANISAAYFSSTEFQQTGYEVYRARLVAFGVPLRYDEFLKDVAQIGNGVVVGQAGWQAKLEQQTQNYFKSLVSTPEFFSKYPAEISNIEFITALNANVHNALSADEAQSLISALNTQTLSRAEAVRRIAENQTVATNERNRALVLMEYFGYLRRNPDDAPDKNLDGYNFWLQKLVAFDGDDNRGEMVKAFISSPEYRRRFGAP